MTQTSTHFMNPHKRHRMIQTITHFMKPHERHRHRMIQTSTHFMKPHKRHKTQNDTDTNPLHEATQKTQDTE